MPASIELKNAAKDDADHWAEVVDYGAFALAAMAAHPLGWPPAVGVAGLMLVGKKKVRAANRIANDPPSGDFRIPTRARKPRIHTESLRSAPNGPLVAELLPELLTAAALEEAMITADERAQGAREAGESRIQVDRLLEAQGFALDAAVSNEEARSTLAVFAGWLHASDEALPQELRRPRYVVPRESLAELLSDYTAATLFRAGFGASGLRNPVRQREVTDPYVGRQLAERLTRAGQASGQLGGALREWAASIPHQMRALEFESDEGP